MIVNNFMGKTLLIFLSVLMFLVGCATSGSLGLQKEQISMGKAVDMNYTWKTNIEQGYSGLLSKGAADLLKRKGSSIALYLERGYIGAFKASMVLPVGDLVDVMTYFENNGGTSEDRGFSIYRASGEIIQNPIPDYYNYYFTDPFFTALMESRKQFYKSKFIIQPGDIILLNHPQAAMKAPQKAEKRKPDEPRPSNVDFPSR